MDSYDYIIGESTDPEPKFEYIDSYGNVISRPHSPEHEQSYSANYPPMGENFEDSIIDDARTATFYPVNSAEQQTSSTLQEGNVGNIAVQYHEQGPGAR